MTLPRLTELVQGGGCARKLPAESLVRALANVAPIPHPWATDVVGPMDDAAVVSPGEGAPGLVMTIDVLTAMVDDPRLFGRIAAANALSDVYAMGGVPQVALSFVGFPTDKLPVEILEQILLGMRDACVEARCAIVGGHTIVDAEPKAGLAVTGTVDPARVLSHRNGSAGDILVLTKPIGTGIVSQALKKEAAPPEAITSATREMIRLNDVAASLALAHGARAATDVTGFGVLGHLKHLVEASRVDAEIVFDAVPLHPHVRALAEAGHVPGGSKKNLGYVGGVVDFAEARGDLDRQLLADAQTSGGLLVAVGEARANDLVAALADAGMRAAAIGRLTPMRGAAPRIRVA